MIAALKEFRLTRKTRRYGISSASLPCTPQRPTPSNASRPARQEPTTATTIRSGPMAVGQCSFCLQGAGRYTSQWSNVGNWVGGKGWQTGDAGP